MPTITATLFVQAPVAEVFDAFADVEHAAGRVTGITRTEKLTPGPVGLGTSFRETRKMFGREATETFTFSAFEPHTRYELSAVSCGAEFRTEFLFASEGAGTRVDATLSTRAVSLWAKLFTPMAYLMRGMLRRCLVQDMDQLRAWIEAGRKAA